jgi:hypothetical protein
VGVFIMKAETKEHRKHIQRLYGSLYKRVSGFDLEKCIYCNDVGWCLDHCPPISKVEYLNVDEYKKAGGKFILYPACRLCNSLLGDYGDTDFYNRLEFLLIKYNKRIKKLPVWTDEEIKQMKGMLKSFIEAKRHKYSSLDIKIKAIQGKIISTDYIDLE